MFDHINFIHINTMYMYKKKNPKHLPVYEDMNSRSG